MDRNQSDIYPNGTIIADRYEITSFLAQGGMAQIYVANQRQINREVALKVLSAMYTSNQSVVMRFLREAQVVGHLTHPNTVRIYDMGETPDHRLFIAMEMLYGEELSERIKRGCIPPAEAIDIVKQVAGSLSEAHQMGVIHRDLKPDNIFLTTHQSVKVLDFGIAKLRDDSAGTENGHRLTKAGTAPGTPEYMSPEQARGQELDGRSDLYSLGIVLYEMLCGHPPFEDSSFLGTILMQVQTAPPPLPNTVPEPLRSYVVNRLLPKDPNTRPDNAEMLIYELETIQRQITRISRSSASEHKKSKDLELDQARAEIEALRQELEQTKEELNRSKSQTMSPVNVDRSEAVERDAENEISSSGVLKSRGVPKTMHNIAASSVSVPTSNRGEYHRHTVNAPTMPAAELEDSATFRPVETLTGRQSRTMTSVSNANPQTTFMMFAQPLCSKMGPDNVQEALHLAQGIWNASVLGGQAVEEIYKTVAGSSAMSKLIDVMLARKEKYFPDEIWQVDSLVVDKDEQGRLSIAFECRLPGE